MSSEEAPKSVGVSEDFELLESKGETQATFEEFVQLALTFMEENLQDETPVVRFRTPAQMWAEFSTAIPEEGVGLHAILADVRQCMELSVRTGHKRFFNQLWAGTDKAAVLGEWLTAVLNSSMYTWEVAPVFTVMEMSLIERLHKFIGWDSSSADGVFAPGGAHSNLLGVVAARNHAAPHVKQEGYRDTDRLVAFTSRQSHYTIKRAVSVMGLGMQACVYVDADEHGRMRPDALAKAVQAAIDDGQRPFLINATCGTTVYGAYEDLNAIADVAERHNIWLHIDACWGGHCLVSERYRHKMAGCERANSIAWTATKCFGLPQQCSALLVRERRVLAHCNAMNEDYLFHDHDEKDYDLGDRTLNCGRRVDALKLWIAWKVHGQRGFEQRVEHAFAQAQYMAERVRQSEHFELLNDPVDSLNVCFFYVPEPARALAADDPKRHELVDKATLQIRRRLQLEGRCLFNYSDLPGVQGHFFRFITCNPSASSADIDFCLDECIRIGTDIFSPK